MDTTRLSIEIPARDHKKLKIMANANGLTLKDFVLIALNPILHPSKKPNKTTRKVMEETDRGEGLISCDNMEDFWEQMGLNE